MNCQHMEEKLWKPCYVKTAVKSLFTSQVTWLKNLTRVNCDECKSLMIDDHSNDANYSSLLSRGGLIKTSKSYSSTVAVIYAQI